MSRSTPTTILPIQRAMCGANPRAWRDGIVVEVGGDALQVLLLDGGLVRLRVADVRDWTVGEPVAHHPVAEVLAAGAYATTARAA